MHNKCIKSNQLEFQIKNDDYFRTLSVILDSLAQVLKNEGSKRSNVEVLARVKDELMHLQKYYKIIKREQWILPNPP